jgi:hypothetical protein
MKYFIVCPKCEHIHIYDDQQYIAGHHNCPKCDNWLLSDEIPEPMPAISVMQPWAWLLCSGIKDIENRTWKMPEKHKGKWVLIHASAKRLKTPFDLLTNEQYDSIGQENRIIANNSLEYSAIIGAVKFKDCFINHSSIWAEKSEGISAGGHVIDNTKPIIWNWLVSHPILFEKPILNVKGKLSFFYPTFE